MIETSAAAASIMASGTYTFYSRVESWRDGELLDGDVPIAAGTQSTDMTINVPESCQLTVPRLYEGVSYVPGKDRDHPLACWGQRLHISLGVGLAGGDVEWYAREWLYIHESQPDGADGVSVQGSGYQGLLLEAGFVSPVPPTCHGNQVTFGQMLRKFVEPAIHLDLTAAPPDRLIPINTVWDDGRLDSVNELLAAWPAAVYINVDGLLAVIPVGDTKVSSLDLSDADEGTTMKWGADITRDGAANCVVSRGNDSTGADVQAVAYDLDASSPTFYGGPFAALPVPYVYQSSLLTTVGECQASANAILLQRRQQSARTLNTTAIPYLSLQARDGVTVTSDTEDLDREFGIVDKLTLPLTADSGVMQLSVRLP